MRSLTLDAQDMLHPRGYAPPPPLISWPTPRVGTVPRRRTGRTAAPAGDEIKYLVLRARDGDAEAFGALYDHYVELVYRYVYYRVGSHPLAEDLTSDTFLRALRRMSDFNWQGKDFGAWLVTIARNLVADHFKSSRFRLEICTAELLEPDRLDSDRLAEGPERAVLDRMTNRALLSAVKRLGSEQQECVVLRFMHGLSVAETALVMGKKAGAIKALQYRAVRSLGRMLPKDLRT